MPASPAADPILKRFRAAPDVLYGDRIERVMLFGSRARGDRGRTPTTTWRCF
jgi:predicted nucleotidyltransferase